MDEYELISQSIDPFKPIDVPPNAIQVIKEALEMVDKTMEYDSKQKIFQDFDNMLTIEKLKEMLRTDCII